jgi:hypothetical protein
MRRATLSLLLLLGCGTAERPGMFLADAQAPSFDTAAARDAAVALGDAPALGPDVGDPQTADAATTDYPPGPYGARVGSTLADLSWEGYVNPAARGLASTTTYGPTSMSALRGGRRGYGLVFISEFL